MASTNEQIFSLYESVLNETFNSSNYASMDIYPISFTVTERGREKNITDVYGRPRIELKDIISVIGKHVNRRNEVEEYPCGYIETKFEHGDDFAEKLTKKYANKWICVKVPKVLLLYANPENIRIRGVGITILDPQPPPPTPEPPPPPPPPEPPPKREPEQMTFPFIHPPHD